MLVRRVVPTLDRIKIWVHSLSDSYQEPFRWHDGSNNIVAIWAYKQGNWGKIQHLHNGKRVYPIAYNNILRDTDGFCLEVSSEIVSLIARCKKIAITMNRTHHARTKMHFLAAIDQVEAELEQRPINRDLLEKAS